jgi:cation diffusion facilitator CzcD-associated flavoprotein CzcO
MHKQHDASEGALKQDIIHKDVVIIGTGFGGLGMGIKLKQSGNDDFVIIEKGQGSGGCWRENSYPGAACDVPSLLYSFSFEPKHDWSRAFAPQKEIESYLKHCEKKYQLSPHIHFNSEVSSAKFNESLGRWLLTTTAGKRISARIFVSACGQLSQPATPIINGLESFSGKVMHSAHWDHDYKLSGKKVAVIGTGASAIQFVPEVAKQVEKLHVLQRSAPYILPKPDRAYSTFEQSLLKLMPGFQKLRRLGVYVQYEARVLGFSSLQFIMSHAKRQCANFLKKTIKDPTLRAKLTPNYNMGCKRILISNNYLPTFNQDHVSLETCGIDKIKEHSIILKDGRALKVDTIIYGTGFKATEFLTPINVTGLQGKVLNEQWQKGAEAYLGITVKDFPNFFMLYGPNTNLGHNSIVYMLESQIRYTLNAIKALNAAPKVNYLNMREDKQSMFNDNLQQKLKNTVWQKGCKSWYINNDGKNTVNWPGFTFKYRHITRSINLKDYHLVKKAS